MMDAYETKTMTEFEKPPSGEGLPLSSGGGLASSGAAAGAAEVPRTGGFLRYAVPSLVVAGGATALDYVRRRFQNAQTFLPELYPNGVWNPSTYGLTVEDVWFGEKIGPRLHGWWMEARGARATVLYCHGNAGNITNRIGVYKQLQKLKVNVLAFDYRGYGRSDGTPSERGLLEDSRTAFDFLSDRGVDSNRVVLFGHSLGGAVAIDCALHRPAAGLVAQSTFTSMRDMARARYPGLPVFAVTSNQFRSIDKVPHLEMPKLFIHGTADETVPHSLGERLFSSAAAPKDWYSVPHAGHNDIALFGGLRYMRRLKRFLSTALP